MFLKAKGIFSALSRTNYDVHCDLCQCATNAKVARADTGDFVYLAPGKAAAALCSNCFNRGLENYRAVDFDQSAVTGQLNCAICLSRLNFNARVANAHQRHLCWPCRRSRTHPDNMHAFESEVKKDGWHACTRCGTLRVRKGDDTYTYIWLGETTERHAAPECCDKGLKPYQCEHDFLFAAEYRKGNTKYTVEDASREDRAMKRSIPILDDGHPFVTLSMLNKVRNGYQLMWCRKSGAQA